MHQQLILYSTEYRTAHARLRTFITDLFRGSDCQTITDMQSWSWVFSQSHYIDTQLQIIYRQQFTIKSGSNSTVIIPQKQGIAVMKVVLVWPRNELLFWVTSRPKSKSRLGRTSSFTPITTLLLSSAAPRLREAADMSDRCPNWLPWAVQPVTITFSSKTHER